MSSSLIYKSVYEYSTHNGRNVFSFGAGHMCSLIEDFSLAMLEFRVFKAADLLCLVALVKYLL